MTFAPRALAAALVQSLALTARAQPFAAIDDAGHRIEPARPAQRIVSLAPHLTEQLFSIGAGHRMVGTTESSTRSGRSR